MDNINKIGVGISALRYMAAGVIGVAVALAGVMMASSMTAQSAHAAQVSSDNNIDLKELILLNTLFQGQGSMFGGSGEGGGGLLDDNSGLNQLIALNELFDDTNNLFGEDGILGDSNNGLLGGEGGDTSLGDLIVLNTLFQGGGLFGGGDGTSGGTTGGLFGNSQNGGLGQLIVLNELFSDGGSLFSGSGQTVVVESGDTLAEIAAVVYGDATMWPRIASANDIVEPRALQVGQTLTIPSANGMNGGLNLENLILLNTLFGNGNGGGLFGGTGNPDSGDTNDSQQESTDTGTFQQIQQR